jgi:hypothetical protein
MTILQDYKLTFNTKLKFNFNGGELTSDSGLIVIEEFIDKLGFREMIERFFVVSTDTADRKHTNPSLCFQLILFIIAGYHHQKNVDFLRHDPIFNAILNDLSLPSQSVISRFMNRLTEETEKHLELINETLLDLYYQINPPEHMVFDVDSTDFPTYGNQEKSGYNGHYQTISYHPLVVYDERTGYCLRAQLRPGNVYTSRDVASFLRPILTRSQMNYSSVYRLVRGDSGFATPELYDLCEETDTHYVIRLKENKRLVASVKELEEKVKDVDRLYEEQVVYDEFLYQATSWKHPRRVVVQVRRKAGQLVADSLFIVTDMESHPEIVIKFYAKRGKMENFIKEGKRGFRMDKVSHKSFDVNANRMQMTVLAYNLIKGLQQLVLPYSFQKMQIETLRRELFKVAAKKVKQANYIIFKVCSHFIHQEVWIKTLEKIQSLSIQKE